MTYGLRVTTGSANTILQIDSDTVMKDYVAVAGSSSSTTVPATFNTVQDLLFVNTSVSSGQCKTLYLVNDSGTYKFIGQTNPSNTSVNTGMAYVSAAYILLKPIATLSSPSGTYGLQVYNSGNQLAFDSRYYTVGFNTALVDYHTSLSRSGNPAADDPLTSDFTLYPVLDTLSSSPISPLNPVWKTGYLFANNHTTYGTGIFWSTFSQGFFGGGTYTPNYAGNLIGKSI